MESSNGLTLITEAIEEIAQEADILLVCAGMRFDDPTNGNSSAFWASGAERSRGERAFDRRLPACSSRAARPQKQPTSRQLAEKRQHLCPSQLLAEHCTARSIRATSLKNILAQIQPDDGNFRQIALSIVDCRNPIPSSHKYVVWRGLHHQSPALQKLMERLMFSAFLRCAPAALLFTALSLGRHLRRELKL